MGTSSETLRSHPTRLAEILASEGRRQSWLAEQIGVDQATMSHYVHGKHVPEDRQRLIAGALGRSVDDVFPTEQAAA